jgi:hypothetical protein
MRQPDPISDSGVGHASFVLILPQSAHAARSSSVRTEVHRDWEDLHCPSDRIRGLICLDPVAVSLSHPGWDLYREVTTRLTRPFYSGRGLRSINYLSRDLA